MRITSIGCIGCGAMGGALLSAFAEASGTKIALFGYNRSPRKMDDLLKKGIIACKDEAEATTKADLVLLAVKPYQLQDVIKKIVPCLTRDKILVSIAAGTSLASLKAMAGNACPIARCMPTTTARVAKGVFAFCFEENFAPSDRGELLKLFSQVGLCLELAEEKFTDFSAFIGAGPAYIFAVMHALEQAGLTLGFPLLQGRAMLNELVSGCAALAAQEDKPYISMRNDVCSPGGLSIAGVNVLDRAGLTGVIVDAVLAAAKRGREMEF